MNRFAAIAVLALGMPAAALATPLQTDYFTGSYTAVTTSNGAGTPTINSGNASLYFPSSFAGTLTTGQTTTPTDFLLVSPTSGHNTVTGSIMVDFSFSDGSAVTSVSNSAGANLASLVNGKVQVDANYAINYAAQTDCITWSGSCTPDSRAGAIKTELSNTVAVDFADGAVLDVNLYSWQDWNMEPMISFDMVSGPGTATPVPEPASIALLATALAGLTFLMRRRRDAV